jgi:hypothetical protein
VKASGSTFVTDFFRTKNFIVASRLAAGGWSAANINSAVLESNNSFFYIYDLPTGWAWMCQIADEGMRELTGPESILRREGLDTPELPDAARSMLASLIYAFADNRAPNPDFEDLMSSPPLKRDQTLSMWAAIYASGTKTFVAGDSMRSGGHFVILNYRKAGGTESKLRPFMMNCPTDFVAPVETFLAGVEHVIAIDKTKHPEWFLWT